MSVPVALAGNSGSFMVNPVAYFHQRFERDTGFSLADHGIMLCRSGSHSYNTNTLNSDEDFFAVCIPPARHLIGLRTFDGWEPEKGSCPGGLDLKVYGIRKYITLLLNGNPNVIETLYLEPRCYVREEPWFEALRFVRRSFLSKRTYRALAGYASAQFKKMTAGQKQNYMGRERKEWVDTIGYDPKDASHLIRLHYMGIELARDGHITPWLTGWRRATVIEIKQGKWKLDDVKQYSEDLYRAAEDEFATTVLPDEPYHKGAEGLLMEMIREAVR